KASGKDVAECHVGILSTREDHDLHVRYKNATGYSTYAFTHPTLQQMNRDIVIETVNSSGGDTSRGATLHNHDHSNTWGAPSDRFDVTNTSGNINDFNWIIDFEGRELHNGKIDFKTHKLWPVLRFKVGEFYTAKVSDPAYYVIKDGFFERFGHAA